MSTPTMTEPEFNIRRWLQALAVVLFAAGALTVLRSVVPETVSATNAQIPLHAPPPFAPRGPR